MIIVRIARIVLETNILTGGQKRLIPRIKLNSAQEDFAYIISRIQFPLPLYFSITINESQGQSFERVGVDLWAPPFSHSQFYVAMSRVKDVRRLSILILPRNAGNGDNKILKKYCYLEGFIRENRL
jgi:ATP-dependent exoDNAse (exonuclease V) alpha subunit